MQPIDFKAMYAAEKKRLTEGVTPAVPLGPTAVFNMLNDARHLVIYDLRGQAPFEVAHVRDSFLLRDLGKEEKVFSASSRIVEMDMQLGGDKLRRLLLIVSEDAEIDAGALAAGAKLFDKVFRVKGGFEALAAAFPWCVVRDSKREYLLMANVNMDLARKKELTSGEKEIVAHICAKSRYPFVAGPGELYVGSFVHLLNSR